MPSWFLVLMGHLHILFQEMSIPVRDHFLTGSFVF